MRFPNINVTAPHAAGVALSLAVVAHALVPLVAQAQVRCTMPNGVVIEQMLSAACPHGAVKAETMNGTPAEVRKPPATTPAVKPSAAKTAPPAPAKQPRQAVPPASLRGSNLITYQCKDANGVLSEQACPDYEQRRAEAAQMQAERERALNWVPRVGMTADEVTAYLKHPECHSTKAFKWCGYWEVNSTKSAYGTREQWVFRRGYQQTYLYFENGVLTTVQD